MQPPVRRWPQIVAVLVFVAAMASCTITIGDPQTPDPSTGAPTRSSQPSATDTPSVDAPGRLVVLAADGTLITSRPDGTDRIELYRGDGADAVASQPTWSTDGSRLAWVERVGDSASIGTAGPRGEETIRTSVPIVPFYLSWDPTSTKVAFLGAASGSGAVLAGVLDAGDDSGEFTYEPVGTGAPFFYFAWSPDGRAILAHVAADRLDQLALNGGAQPVSTRPGAFATPVWVGDTRVWVESAGGNRHRLVTSNAGRKPTVLATMRGAISFVARPDGGAIAFQAVETGEEDVFAPRPGEPDDGVRVVELSSGRVRKATASTALSFWWSPVGGELLVLAPDPAPGGSSAEVSWSVWNGAGEGAPLGAHTPTLTMLRDYMPFFTQYAQSSTPWAPDASAFAFAGGTADEGSQIFVQTIGGDAVAVADGEYVAWSPSSDR
jgi:TolB protein